jgi:mono/diheme cytochrome c family protein
MMPQRLFILSLLSGLTQAHSETVAELGQSLFENTCQTCHQQPSGTTQRLAPPMHAVKQHYQQNQPDTQSSIEQMTTFILHPDADSSQMPGAVRRFGLMPDMGLSTTEAAAVASYVMHTDLSEAGHSASPGANSRQPMSEDQFRQSGKAHALAAKAELGKNLMQAINQQGHAGAVSFCHEQAIPLTLQVARERGVSIRRVSDQPRNPDNTAQGDQLAYIDKAKQRLAAQQIPEPQVTSTGQHITAYYPITTNAMCLGCHGQPESDIKPDTLSRLNALYPDDQATGYAANQLRGIWVISQAPSAAGDSLTNDKSN